MATKRNFPFVWPTWLTALLAGDAQCWYAPWLKANFQIERLDRGGFDLAAWKVKHAEMVALRAEELRQGGWTVTVEDQNAFKLRGRSALLSGKPDIVAIRGEDALVEDCKGGARRDGDVQQVLIYLYALPKVRADLEGKRLMGVVRYREHPITIQPEQFSEELRTRMLAALVTMGDPTPPVPVPSASECGQCDISKTDCPQRMDTAQQGETGTEEF